MALTVDHVLNVHKAPLMRIFIHRRCCRRHEGVRAIWTDRQQHPLGALEEAPNLLAPTRPRTAEAPERREGCFLGGTIRHRVGHASAQPAWRAEGAAVPAVAERVEHVERARGAGRHAVRFVVHRLANDVIHTFAGDSPVDLRVIGPTAHADNRFHPGVVGPQADRTVHRAALAVHLRTVGRRAHHVLVGLVVVGVVDRDR